MEDAKADNSHNEALYIKFKIEIFDSRCLSTKAPNSYWRNVRKPYIMMGELEVKPSSGKYPNQIWEGGGG